MFDPSQIIGNFRYVPGTVQFSNTKPAFVTGANPNRALIYFTGVNASGGFFFYVAGDQQRSPAIWQVPAGTGLRFTWSLDGPLSTFEWWCAPQGTIGVGTCQLSWYEVIWIEP